MQKKEQNDSQFRLYEFIKNISPSELASYRQKHQDTSSRDKALLLKRILEIEELLSKLDVKISLKKDTIENSVLIDNQ